MKLFKFLFYGFGFFIGLTIAFCSNTNYDKQTHTYDTPSTAPSLIDKSPNSKISNPLVLQGKNLFKSNCASCHNKNMVDDMTGPALAGTSERWKGREDLLYQWIRNSSYVIASGDPYALDIYNRWNKSVMTAFPNLKDDEIEAILAYINRP